jgi:molecular chaperone DnaJ
MGAELEIPTIDGNVKYNLPAGTQSGTTFRLRGKGIPELRSRNRGDQFVTVKVQVPTSLNAEQKEALNAFGAAMGETVQEGGVKGFFEKYTEKHKKKK